MGDICIYVFSGTGTSLAVAKKIGESIGNVEIKLIPNILENAESGKIKAGTPVVGFVFPNYFGGIPDMVSRFIRAIDLTETNYIFAVITAGAGHGYGFKFLEQELIKKGKKLNYGKSIGATSNYITAWYYKFVCKTGKKKLAALQKLEERAKRFAEDIAVRKNEIAKKQFFYYRISHLLSSKNIRKDTSPHDKDFSVNENCTGCKTCEKICQVNNIKIENSKPVFLHNCQRCMACLQYCPQKAIGTKGRTLNRPRYFHPDYTAKEMIYFVNENKNLIKGDCYGKET